MLKLFSKISIVLFLIAAPFLFYGFGNETLKIIADISLSDSRWFTFFIGGAIFFPCFFVAKRLFPSTWNYLQTLEHEITHLLIGLLFLKIPVGIRVSAHAGGEVRQIGLGTTGQTWIALAPYFFPTISLAVLVFAYFAQVRSTLVPGLLGWTTAFHLITNWAETSFRQPDLKKAGWIKSILILPVMNVICYGAVMAFVADGRQGFGNFLINGFNGALSSFGKIYQML